MIRRSGIIQRVDHRPSVTSFRTSRSFALSIIHHDHIHLSADFTEMLLSHWSRDRRTFHLSLHVHDHSGVVLEVDEDALLPVPRLPLRDHTTDITFFLSTGLPFVTKHIHMTSSLVTVILFQRPPMPFKVIRERLLASVLSAQFMTLIPTLILNLASSWSLSWSSPVLACSWPSSFHPLWARSFPQWLLFSAAGGSSLLVLLWTPLCTRLSGPVSASRADPRVHHRTFSHVLHHNFPSEAAHNTPSHRLRLAEPSHALSRAMRGLGDPSPTLRKTPHPPGTVRGCQ